MYMDSRGELFQDEILVRVKIGRITLKRKGVKIPCDLISSLNKSFETPNELQSRNCAVDELKTYPPGVWPRKSACTQIIG
jgi:hypothetical protein